MVARRPWYELKISTAIILTNFLPSQEAFIKHNKLDSYATDKQNIFSMLCRKKNTWTLICFYRPKRSYLKFLLTHYVSSPQITELCIFAHILRQW